MIKLVNQQLYKRRKTIAFYFTSTRKQQRSNGTHYEAIYGVLGDSDRFPLDTAGIQQN